MIDGGLYKLFKKNLPRIHWQRIEIGGTGQGVPDLNGCVDGIEFWVELKQDQKGRMILRPEQIGWMIERTRHGGLVRIAVRLTVVSTDVLVIFDGPLVERLETMSIDANLPNAIDFWEGGPNRWDWEGVFRAITMRSPC
jgi:Holliday junction resolvase